MISEISRLTDKKISELPKKIIDKLNDLYDLEELSDYDSEYLVDDNYTYGKITLKTGETFNFIHGFPGDNPAGIAYDDNSEIIANFGEGMQITNDLEKWYSIITEEVTDLSLFCIRDEEGKPEIN